MRCTRTLATFAATLLFAMAAPGMHPAHAQRAAGRPLGPAPHAVIYAGMQGGGVYQSTDNGTTWQEADTGLPSDTDVSALAVAPSDLNTIYAGTGGQGIWVSTDGGQSWNADNGNSGYSPTAVAQLPTATIAAMAVDPGDPILVYAATGNQVFWSDTGGQTWDLGLFASANILSLAVDPLRPGTLLAGSDSSGTWYSTNSGRTWVQPQDDISAGTQITALVFDPQNADVAYAATDSGIYQSIDAGQSWQYEGRGIPNGTSFVSIVANPRYGAEVVALASDGTIYRTDDGGTSWTTSGGLDSSANTLLYVPAQNDSLLAGGSGDNPLSLSTDGGADWQQSAAYLGGSTILALAGAARQALPTDPVPAPLGNPADVQYFSATHHIVRGLFLAFYRRYGGLNIFGLPLTEQFDDQGTNAQYFERARLVLVGTRVSLTPLGAQLTAGRYFPPVAPFASTTARVYFPSTRHALAGRFLAFWRSHDGGFLFGPPISEPLYEQNGDGTGRRYLVQYFANARLEYHPELAGTRYTVTLGQMGRQALRQRGWL